MSSTKDHILHVALNLFLQSSYKEVTMSELVEKSGMSKGAFYYYFKSKEELFCAVMKMIMDLGELDYGNFSQTSLKDFYEGYLMKIQTAKSDSKSMELIFDSTSTRLSFTTLIFEAFRLFPSVRELVQQSNEKELNMWVEIVLQAIDRGEIRSNMTAAQIAGIFINISAGLAMRSRLSSEEINVIEYTRELWQGFYEGLRNPNFKQKFKLNGGHYE
ncbi:MAG TPA: TetR/AcrR family transcriptional regulator [Clostridium sp.]